MTTDQRPDDPTLPSAYFDRVYAADADPWRFETSAYEAEKYRTTVDALGARRFRHAFEIGCSIGVLTELLAQRTRRLLAVDASETPLVRARARLAHAPHVAIERMRIPDEFPSECPFDLVVLSEVGYYWSMPTLASATARIVDALVPSGLFLLVHWTPPVHDYPLTGDAVHEHVLAVSAGGGPLEHRLGLRGATYRLDLFERRAR